MKPNRWLALACVGSALACGILMLRHTGAGGPAPKAPTGANTRDRSNSSPTLAEHRKERPSRNAEHALGSKKKPATASTPDWKVITGSHTTDGKHVLSEAQWRAHAAQVEMEANHELKRLAGLLDLDSYQQAKVFSALAQRSSAWLPGMQTGSSRTTNPTATVTDVAAATDVAASLNDDQKQTLAQEEMDRQAWWEEVLPQLLPPPLQGGGVLTSEPTGDSVAEPVPADTNAPPATKAFEGD